MTRASRQCLVCGTLVGLLACRTNTRAFADEPRAALLLNWTGGAPDARPFGLAIDPIGPSRSMALPSLRFAGGRSGLRLAGYSTDLHRLVRRGWSVTPRLGEQRLKLDFQPSALAGMAIDARPVRGFTFAAARPGFSGTMLVGRAGGTAAGFLELPRLFAFTGTLTPGSRLAISPRIVAPLGRSDAAAGADPTMGAGLRADLGRHISVVGDIGGTRTRSKGWARLAALGVRGQWTRGAFEAITSQADAGFTLLGGVPFAAQDRQAAAGRIRIANGLTFDGQVITSTLLDRSQPAARTTTGSAKFGVDRFRAGGMLVTMNHSKNRAERSRDVALEWRQKGHTVVTIRWRERHEGVSPASAGRARRLHVELHYASAGNRPLALRVRSSRLLSHSRTQEPRLDALIGARVSAGPQIGLIGEANLAASEGVSAGYLRDVSAGAEIGSFGATAGRVFRGATLRVVVKHTVGNRRALWQRLEVRFARVLAY